ncbi:MAG: hypothetical protein QOE90_3019 [Thermoplasmata archaeon]|jgi:thiol-disulfide isomerase/thioredoxin|nr:hypothetical protein [Thermoplasmata archaeon]
MRAAALLVALALTGCLGGSPGLVGKPVPAFSLVTSAGEPVNETTWLGQYVILDLMATWCAPCKVEVEHLKDVHAQYGDRVPILSIDVDPTESSQQMDRFFLDHNATWPRAFDFDGKVGRAIGLGIPTLVIVGPDGKVVYQHEGEVDVDTIRGVVGAARCDEPSSCL